MSTDYSKCGVCGLPLGPDKMIVQIDNGHVLRTTYAHRRHRYVAVQVATKVIEDGGTTSVPQIMLQTRTDLEIENLAFEFRSGKLQEGWE